MKTILLTLLFCINASLSKAQSNWFTYKNDAITILFPKEPEVSSQSVATYGGEIIIDLLIYEDTTNKDNNLAYSFSSSTYPDSLINSGMKEKLPQFFRASIDGAVANVNGKLPTEKVVSFNGFPGREITIDYGNGIAIIRMHFYLVRNKGFFTQTISAKGKENNPEALKFHQSFKLN